MERGVSKLQVIPWLFLTYARILRRAETYVSGRYWLAEVMILAVLYSVFFGGGIDDQLYDPVGTRYHPAYYLKIAHPLTDVSQLYPPDTHAAKINFRLTVPVILHLLGAPPNRRCMLPVLTGIAVLANLALCAYLSWRFTKDRVCALFVVLTTAATQAGSFGLTLYFDAIALCQVLVAMIPGLHWSLRGLLVFTAGFTDERALLPCLFLVVPALARREQAGTNKAFWRRPEFLAVASGMAAYLLTRLLLTKYANLSSPMGKVGLEVLAGNAALYHGASWFAIEGSWLLVGLALLALRRQHRWLELAAFAFVTAAVLGGGFLVDDVLRSIAYLTAAVPVALAILSRHESIPHLRLYCLLAFLLCLAAGDFTIMPNPCGPQHSLITRFLSYLLQGLRHGFQL